MTRILTAAVLLGVLWPATEWGPVWLFLLLAGGIIALATWEGYDMMTPRGARPFRRVGVAAVLAVVWAYSGLEPTFAVALPLTVLAAVAPMLALATREDTTSMVVDTVGTIFPVVFIGLTLGHVVRLRGLPGEDGRDLLYLLFVCVILSDTAAYYVGRTIGKRPFAPRLSPKKTWAGTIGGLVASLGGALLAHAWFYQRLPLVHALVLGVLIGVAGCLGDLTESTFKRAAGVKDSSSLLPGHGGALDRTDSLLFAAPVLYYYYQGFLRGMS